MSNTYRVCYSRIPAIGLLYLGIDTVLTFDPFHPPLMIVAIHKPLTDLDNINMLQHIDYICSCVEAVNRLP
jgi:hypothetical protein